MAILVLAVLGATVVAWLLRVYRRTSYTPAQVPLYILNLVLGRILWRARIIGSLPVGPKEGAVIVSNHIGPIDPGFIGLATTRVVHWFVAEEYVRRGVMATSLRILAVIPARRGGIDTSATKMAIRYAQQGELVGLFPEGRINTSSEFMLPVRPGAILVALKARVKLIPCYLEGTPNDGTPHGFLFVPARAKLTIGEPFDLSPYYERDNDKEALADITRELIRRIAALAGRPDHEPLLAGRRWKPGS